MRRSLLAGNWKMNCTTAESAQLAASVAAFVAPLLTDVDVVLAPPFPSLAAVRAAVNGTSIEVAAQDMHWAERGAFTGAVSPVMVAEHASRVIVGHSERCQLFGETDADVHRKVHAAFDHALLPIVCVGESVDQRDAGIADSVVEAQLALATDGLRDEEAAALVVAYEPVWAIGSGRACDPLEAARVAKLLRAFLELRFGSVAAAGARVLYGGSVNPDNVDGFLSSADIDGALVGAMSLSAEAFAALAKAAMGSVGRVPA